MAKAKAANVRSSHNRIKRNRTVSEWILDIVKVVVLTLVTIVTIYPFWNIFVVSINDAKDAVRGGLYFWPRIFSIASYKEILSRDSFRHAMLMTVIRTVVGTPLAVFVTSMCAYALSRKDLVGHKFFTVLFIFTMYFGGGQVPYYMVLKGIGLLDTFAVLIFPLIMSVYNMILIRSYIDNMPAELFEAVKIDGGNDLIVFFRIVLPLAKPILMTVALFVAIVHWNSWFDAYLYTSRNELKVMQQVLVEILNQYQTGANQAQDIANQQAGVTITPDSLRMSSTMIATIPIILVYPFIQKYFVKGIMLGAVKG